MKIFITIVTVIIAGFIFLWFGCRIEVNSGELVVLIAKTGKKLPSGTIIAPDENYKGIQLDVLAEGRYFRNPLFWDWKIQKITPIPAGHVGVLTRLYGKNISASELSIGKLFADENEKGLLREILKPGNYRFNLFAYDVEIFPAVEVPAGFVGIVTELAEKPPTDKNSFVVKEGEKGVQIEPLQPGTYYVNPYARRIDLMDIRSQRHEMYGENALHFPTSDGFDMMVMLIVEWAVDAHRAPEVLVRVGEQGANEESNEILQKIVVPALRGYGRIIGSQYSAPEYISGASRIIFQSNLFQRVRSMCSKKGVIIKSVLIGDIAAPEEIAQPIREREIAKEELSRNNARILRAKADQSLARIDAMIDLKKKKVEAETDMLQAIIAVSNQQVAAMLEQEQKLAVAKTDLKSAVLSAKALRNRGKAEADVISLSHAAKADALRKSSAAFGSGENFSKYELTQTLAEKIDTVFTTDDSVIGKTLNP